LLQKYEKERKFGISQKDGENEEEINFANRIENEEIERRL